MKLSTLHRNGGLAALALTLSLGLAACGEDEEPTAGSDTSETPAGEESPMEEASPEAPDLRRGVRRGPHRG